MSIPPYEELLRQPYFWTGESIKWSFMNNIPTGYPISAVSLGTGEVLTTITYQSVLNESPLYRAFVKAIDSINNIIGIPLSQGPANSEDIKIGMFRIEPVALPDGTLFIRGAGGNYPVADQLNIPGSAGDIWINIHPRYNWDNVVPGSWEFYVPLHELCQSLTRK